MSSGGDLDFGQTILGFDLVPCVFVVSAERFVTTVVRRVLCAPSGVGDGSNPAPTIKRTLGSPICPGVYGRPGSVRTPMSTGAKPDAVDPLGASSTPSRVVRDDSGESVVSHQSGDVDSGSEASPVAEIPRQHLNPDRFSLEDDLVALLAIHQIPLSPCQRAHHQLGGTLPRRGTPPHESHPELVG